MTKYKEIILRKVTKYKEIFEIDYDRIADAITERTKVVTAKYDLLFVRNVRDESRRPFRNHMIVADDEIAVIEDRLYVRNECCMGCYKVKYRSDDFTYFRTGTNRYQRDYDTNVEIIHKPGSVPMIKISLK